MMRQAQTRVLVNGTTFAAGEVGQAFSFDGINDAVTNSVPGFTNILNAYTMEFWARPTAGRAAHQKARTAPTAIPANDTRSFPPMGDLET